jgi:hypothetical protein
VGSPKESRRDGRRRGGSTSSVVLQKNKLQAGESSERSEAALFKGYYQASYWQVQLCPVPLGKLGAGVEHESPTMSC